MLHNREHKALADGASYFSAQHSYWHVGSTCLNDEVLAEEEEEGGEEEAGGGRCANFVTWRTSPWTSRPTIYTEDCICTNYIQQTDVCVRENSCTHAQQIPNCRPAIAESSLFCLLLSATRMFTLVFYLKSSPPSFELPP